VSQGFTSRVAWVSRAGMVHKGRAKDGYGAIAQRGERFMAARGRRFDPPGTQTRFAAFAASARHAASTLYVAEVAKAAAAS